ncbi:conserved hypothetical protein [Pediculus humanus corporis]|uniref:Uncharacterized protein n=1 Tax=Pediculus humanus subsp. corporis TaxID=121224 RepID=E0VUC1_PEDHC|nr:uncharacterized protein Phum_PHUM449040 [Pediculus humanus corporis]EEB16977.1 conserved hypothetical protein [Pediculus humanus corporis]
MQSVEEKGFQIDKTIGGSGDFSESSRDGRTYLATRKLPQGLLAYMAVTNNDGEELWKPQPSCSKALSTSTVKYEMDSTPGNVSQFVKKFCQILETPMTCMRKSPEEREKVLEWMDKIISDCNKWIQGEDPHNMDLEALFEMLYEDYKNDPEKVEVLNHPKKLRTILMKDIRDLVSDRRNEVIIHFFFDAKNFPFLSLVLDQYENDQYVEERIPGQKLDEVWLECAKKPMSASTKAALEMVYPPEVIDRIYIIEKGEKEAEKKINELRSGSVDDIKKELITLKKVQQEYKDYYAAYKEVEEREQEFAKEWKEKCLKSEKLDCKEKSEKSDKYKEEMQCEIETAKKNFDVKRKLQNELTQKLEEAREALIKIEDKIKKDTERMFCEKEEINLRKEEIKKQICSLKKKQHDLKCKIIMQQQMKGK